MIYKVRHILVPALMAAAGAAGALALVAYDVYPYFQALTQLENDYKDGKLSFPGDGGIGIAKFNACRAWREKLYVEATKIDRRADWIAPEFNSERKTERACLLKVLPDASDPTEAWVWSFHIRQWLIHFPDKALEVAALKGIANARNELKRHREIYDRQTDLMDTAKRSLLIRNIHAINRIIFWSEQFDDEYNALNSPMRLLRNAEFAVRNPVVFRDLQTWENNMLHPATHTKADATGSARTQ